MGAEGGRRLTGFVQYPRERAEGLSGRAGNETWSASGARLETEPTGLPAGSGVWQEESRPPPRFSPDHPGGWSSDTPRYGSLWEGRGTEEESHGERGSWRPREGAPRKRVLPMGPGVSGGRTNIRFSGLGPLATLMTLVLVAVVSQTTAS